MRKETIGNGRQYFTRSKKRQEEAAANEKDLISSLPLDLKLHILVKLQPKCIAKFISVSKLWSSIVRGKHLTGLFVSRSSTRPSFLFIVQTPGIRKFHSRSQEDQSSGNRTTSSFNPHPISYRSRPVRGLICGEEISNDVSKVICNPTTGQFVTLPRVITWGRRSLVTTFIGYDPVNDQYKVLCMVENFHQKRPSVMHQVFTLGATEKAWRMIKCKHPHFPVTRELCRDGVVYYGAWYEEFLLVSFDVTSEDFGVIKLPKGGKIISHGNTELVNYHGKIALANVSSNASNVNSAILWVLQDFKKQEWSKISFLLPDIVRTWSNVFRCRGTISTGEIIFAPYCLSKDPFFLVYYDLKGNNAKRVDIEEVRDVGIYSDITVYLDHVENPMFLQKEVCWN